MIGRAYNTSARCVLCAKLLAAVAAGPMFLLSGVAEAQQSGGRGVDLTIGMPEQEVWPPAASHMPGQAGRQITLHDILGLREIIEQHVAPDGRAIAFVVREAELDSNRYRTTLWVTGTAPGARPRVLDSAGVLHGVRWTRGGEQLTYVSAREGGVELRTIAGPAGERPQRYVHKLPVAAGIIAVAPDGQTLALVVTDSVTSAQRQRIESQGIVYGPLLTARDLIARTWHRTPTRLAIYSTQTGQLRTIWTAPAVAAGGGVAAVAWSPDGQRVALTYRPSDAPEDVNNSDIAVLSVRDGHFTRLTSWPGSDWHPVWSPDGRHIAFGSQGDIQGRRQAPSVNTIFVTKADGTEEARNLGPAAALNEARIIGWALDGSSVLFERGDRTTSYVGSVRLGSDSVVPVSATAYHVAQCSVASLVPVVSCVRQNATTAAEIAIIDQSQADGVRVLTHLNPQLDSIARGAVRELRWTNRFGEQTNGFLLLPLDYRADTRYPLLVVMYGFGNKFITQAGSLSFPAQAFSAAGFAVLLMNFPAYRPFRWGGDDADAAGQGDRESPLAAIEAAVDTLVAAGVADSTRCGVWGFSMGGYWAELAIVRTRLFKAASINEAASRSPAEYYLWSADWKFVQRSLLGGPPVPRFHDRYAQATPLFMAPPIDVPILRENESTRLDALQYTVWWDQGASMELVFYPDEGHIFAQPLHRFSSMQRNLDWFRFWLLGVEDTDAARAAQFARWRAMRARIDRLRETASATDGR